MRQLPVAGGAGMGSDARNGLRRAVDLDDVAVGIEQEAVGSRQARCGTMTRIGSSSAACS